MEETMEIEMSLSDMVLDFLEELERGEERDGGNELESGDDREGSIRDAKQNRHFWEAQNKLLHEAIEKYSATEKRIQMDMEEVMRKLKSSSSTCRCSDHILVTENCRNCMLFQITNLLRQAGYDSALCKSKWRRSPEIPSGEHSYIDVMVESKNRSKTPMRFIVELNFRAEFEMARGNKEYKMMVNKLPEMFIGKSEKLRNILKIMCEASKKCMKENKMHMVPWRKYQYMESKWKMTAERLVPEVSVMIPAMVEAPNSELQSKMRRASMLTFDLHCTAVQVA